MEDRKSQKSPYRPLGRRLKVSLSAQDEEAVQLWELAGYGVTKVSSAQMISDISVSNQTLNSTPILFTDVVDIMVNNYGVVMNFMQSSGPNSKPATVSRIGMSREHAKSVLQILQVTLNQTEQILPKINNASRRINTSDNNPKTDEKPRS
jgi:hypothetical protein